MPVKKRLKRTLPPNASKLMKALGDEWESPRTSGEPLIVLEGGEGQPIHIYVIWNEWEGLSELERSEIILNVAEQRLDDPSLVTVAMGLTAREAERMGIAVD